MLKARLFGFLITTLSAAACVQGPGDPALPARPQVTIFPSRSGLAERVLAVSVRNVGALTPEDFVLLSGEISDYQASRVHPQELSETLASRRVPVSTWGEPESSEIHLLPRDPLQPGNRYTLAARGYGRLRVFDVNPDATTPFLERLWPPKAETGGTFFVLCGDSEIRATLPLRLEPGGSTLLLEPGFGSAPDGRACAAGSLTTAESGPFALINPQPEPLVDPAPLSLASEATAATLTCNDAEIELGAGCAEIGDDRLILRNPKQALLWVFSASATARLQPMRPDQRKVLRGLEPSQRFLVAGETIGNAGSKTPFSVEVQTAPARAHVVINEVLANPVGPEPANEWIELYNDGAQAVDLTGWRLEDGGGFTELPQSSLFPGQYGLLVRSDFSAGSEAPFPADALVLSVSAIGKAGLSNSGELLVLRSAKGEVSSRFPVLASPHPGVSLARLEPESFDDDPDSFAEHAGPGSSPGAPNQLGPARKQ